MLIISIIILQVCSPVAGVVIANNLYVFECVAKKGWDIFHFLDFFVRNWMMKKASELAAELN